MIRSLFTFLLVLLWAPMAIAQDIDADQSEDALDSIQEPDQDREVVELTSEPGDIVVLRGLDKVTARTRDFEIEIGQSDRFGSLDIEARYCRKRPPEEPPETFAFLEIRDRRTDGFGEEVDGDRIFSGWMLASNPALNPLEHPVYDVWVIDCRYQESADR